MENPSLFSLRSVVEVTKLTRVSIGVLVTRSKGLRVYRGDLTRLERLCVYGNLSIRDFNTDFDFFFRRLTVLEVHSITTRLLRGVRGSKVRGINSIRGTFFSKTTN